MNTEIILAAVSAAVVCGIAAFVARKLLRVVSDMVASFRNVLFDITDRNRTLLNAALTVHKSASDSTMQTLQSIADRHFEVLRTLNDAHGSAIAVVSSASECHHTAAARISDATQALNSSAQQLQSAGDMVNGIREDLHQIATFMLPKQSN